MSVSAAVVGAIAGPVAKALLAKGKARTPLYMDCLQTVALLRQGTDMDIVHVIEEADALMKHITELDSAEDLKREFQELSRDYGGEQ